MGLTAGAVAMSALGSGSGTALAATIDPLKAPRARFWIAALTPVDSRRNYDNGANDALLSYWKSQGADGVLLLGSTGEGQSFSVAERKKVIEQAGKNKHGLDIIVGAGAANLPETIDLCRHAADNGADSVLVVPPYYDPSPKGEGVIDYFDQLFAQVKTPVRYYHIPKWTGVPVGVDVFKALAKYPNFVGVKDSNGDAAEFEAITAALPGLNVVTGTDNLLQAALKHGNGCILASGNVFAKQVAGVFQAYRSGGDVDAAFKKLSDASAAFRAASGGGGEAANKYALAQLTGISAYYVRAPSVPLPEEQKAKIQAAVQQLKASA